MNYYFSRHFPNCFVKSKNLDGLTFTSVYMDEELILHEVEPDSTFSIYNTLSTPPPDEFIADYIDGALEDYLIAHSMVIY